METDRELLVLAAKAAGIEGWIDPHECVFIRAKDRPGAVLGAAIFDPLTHDDDAFRLAVALGMSIHRLLNSVGVSQYGESVGYLGGFLPFTVTESDEEVTRRAIVRAAAEIGKAMP